MSVIAKTNNKIAKLDSTPKLNGMPQRQEGCEQREKLTIRENYNSWIKPKKKKNLEIN